MATDDTDDDDLLFVDHFSADKALTIVEEASVTEAIDAARLKYPAADDIFRAACWVIARSPEIGTVLTGTSPERRLLKLMPNEIAKTPGLLVRYYLKKHAATVDWVKYFPYDKGKAVAPAAYVYKK